MKKIGRGFWLAAGAMILWAIWDGWRYAGADRSLSSYYEGAGLLQQLVHHPLVWALGKVLLGGLLLFAGWKRGKSGKGVAARTAITGLVSLAVLGTWGVSMYCVTAVAAEYAAARYLAAYEDYASTLAERNAAPWLGKGHDLTYKNYDIARIWAAVEEGGHANSFQTYRAAGEETGGFLKLPDRDRAWSAAAVYDGEGNLLACSWEDFFTFEYLTEEQWNRREERSRNNARALFDRAKLTQAGREIVQDGSLSLDARALRLTGSFDGVELIPRTVEAIDWEMFDEALRARGSGSYTVSGLVQDSGLPWISLYEDPEAVASEGEVITLYSDWFDVCYEQPSPGFFYQGNGYDGLDTLVSELGPRLAGGWKRMARYEGLDLILPSVNYCMEVDGELRYSPYYHGREDSGTVWVYTVSAVYCSPWRTAGEELWQVYLLTFLLAVGLILLVRARVQRCLIKPVRQVGEAMGSGDSRSWKNVEDVWMWREGRVLREELRNWSDRMGMQSNEITRLNTALEYAREAEENRRQMTSSIAHELKTPLAVIHSYAEGLKEHAAEEKRDKYIDVILSETERIDGMVLEMLDLSRLEAGRVKLSRDDVSILALTKSIFERLEAQARAKDLRISFDVPEEVTVVADESRIAQVIENFAANAVQYTPEGGRITVRIKNSKGKTSFAIENESPPLPEEALHKVWDTFYRADESRSGRGTGLGLAIAKHIIELHGGQCSVRNTVSGVEFRFTI